jgi:hypothetical protein
MQPVMETVHVMHVQAANIAGIVPKEVEPVAFADNNILDTIQKVY